VRADALETVRSPIRQPGGGSWIDWPDKVVRTSFEDASVASNVACANDGPWYRLEEMSTAGFATFYGFFLVLALFAALEGGFSFKTHATGRKVLPSKSPALSKNPSRAFSTSAGPDSLGAKWLKILVGVQGFEPWTR
jgi:hypothetical protein